MCDAAQCRAAAIVIMGAVVMQVAIVQPPVLALEGAGGTFAEKGKDGVAAAGGGGDGGAGA